MNNNEIADDNDEGIVALNYCAHAIEDLKRLLAGTQPHFVQSKQAIVRPAQSTK